MKSNEVSFSGSELESALKDGVLDSIQSCKITGIVQSSSEKGSISFSQVGCEAWVDIPTSMIDTADQLGSSSCGDHSHPLMEITLKEPTDPQSKILFSLLVQSSVLSNKPHSVGRNLNEENLPSPSQVNSSLFSGSNAFSGFGGGGFFADEDQECCCTLITFVPAGRGRGLGGLRGIVRTRVCISCPSGTKCDCNGNTGPSCW